MKKLKQINFKKIGKWLLKLLLILVSAVVIFFIVIAGYNQISLIKESKKINDYGQKLKVFDGMLNVQVEGNGKETVVLLPGYGTASPVIDFKPLIKELEADYKVVTIEPFGYGLSSQTNRKRNLENVTEEIHEVLRQLNIDSFIMMGHSISGIYGLNYANQYPEEVKAFVGIDTSVPNQPWPGNPTATIDFIRHTGMYRLFVAVKPELFKIPNLDVKENEQYRMLNLKNTGNKSMRAEGIELDKSFEKVKTMTFPKELPVLLFIDHGNAENVPTWRDLHLVQVEHANKGASFELEGGHYLHRTQSPRIVKELKQFLD